ncbi:DNA replication and repair protein RecF, partial [Candidatus Gracilibacteria bacterium]|nr:DNA replication and repair protein RecF [Candidatus Gracilibacteria bacterium]
LLTVLFHPEDLNMLYLAPALRRRYMDILLCQCDRNYLVALSQYNRTLKQRNALLKAVRETQFKGQNTEKLKADLDAWDVKLIEFATPVIEKRQALVDYLNKNLPKLYRKISGDKEDLKVEYQNKIVTNYADELFNRKSRDIMQAKTTAGPHRDDLKFFINGQEISTSASRGEFRTMLLAIKIAEIEYIKAKTGYMPILLLDDVFSELDLSRQKHLLKAIKGCQTIITTTDASNIENIAKDNQTFTIVKIA